MELTKNIFLFCEKGREKDGIPLFEGYRLFYMGRYCWPLKSSIVRIMPSAIPKAV